MKNNDIKKVTIIDDEYIEAYAPFPDDPKEAEEKIKRGILKRNGLTDSEIDRVIDSLEIEYTKGGSDGMFDDFPMTPCKLVKPVQTIEPPPPPPPLPPQPPKDKKVDEPSQIMLQEYYGDREAEKDRRERFKRFKSHIGKKTIDVISKDGEKRQIEIYTVEDYPEKGEDTDKLMLNGFSTRLEKISRAHEGDISLYEIQLTKLDQKAKREILTRYEEMHKVDPEKAEKFKEDAMAELVELSKPENRQIMIQALIDRDIEFLETNNYGYNSHQNTSENLKTLGKHGEKAQVHPVSDKQTKFNKVGLHTINALLTLRNYTKAPVNKAIGTYVVSPIHRRIFGIRKVKPDEVVNKDGYQIKPIDTILETSQKRTAGLFKNKPTHRYQARKDFFAYELSKELKGNISDPSKDMDEKDKKLLERHKISSIIKLAFLPRIKAITHYKEGNIKVLNAGSHEVAEASKERSKQIGSKRIELAKLEKRIKRYEKEIEEYEILAKTAKTPEEKEKFKKLISASKKGLLATTVRISEVERTEIDDVAVDAVGLSQHDKANKSNISKVVTGFKSRRKSCWKKINK